MAAGAQTAMQAKTAAAALTRHSAEDRREKIRGMQMLMERRSVAQEGWSDSAGPAIGRAVKNLMTALRHRVGRDGLDDELLHEIAAILDDAAQRIERVK